MEMELYANLVDRGTHKLLNPTIVVITDRNELDGQLFSASSASQLLPEQPTQIRTRSELREELSGRTTGGIYFTTLQKFGLTKEERESGADHPLLSDRRNIIVIVDEAHRSHYDDLDGYARHLRDALPHATLIAVHRHPDLVRRPQHPRRVRRLHRHLRPDPRGRRRRHRPGVLRAAADQGRPRRRRHRGGPRRGGRRGHRRARRHAERNADRASVAVVNAVYGAPARLTTLADDLVAHWEARRERWSVHRRARQGDDRRRHPGDLRPAVRGRSSPCGPDWHSDELDKGRIKVVYSARHGPPGHAEHVRRDSENKVVKQRLQEVDDELEIVIVKDMMLTGYDSPPLHTLYLDRPLKGALLMQTLARVNRTFRGKQDGLLVAYAPLAENLRKALAEYTERPDNQAAGPHHRRCRGAHRTARRDAAGRVRGLQLDEAADRRAEGMNRGAVGMTAYLRSPQPRATRSPRGRRRWPRGTAVDAAQRAGVGDLVRSETLTRSDARSLYEEVRIYMAKWDADERRSRGEPCPSTSQRLLRDAGRRVHRVR